MNNTYPLSTRKESLHVLPFLFNWNLQNELKEIKNPVRPLCDICTEQTCTQFLNVTLVQQ